MKKFLIVLLAICLSVTLFVSCNRNFKPKTAGALWDKINETMDSLDSYEMDMTGTMALQANGVKLSVDITTKNIVSDQNGNDYYEYSVSDSTMKTTYDHGSFDTTVTEKETSIEAFHNGKMFLSTKTSSGRKRKIYSSLTAKEYLAYKESRNADLSDMDFKDCTNASFAQNEDGTWSMSFSGYTKKTVDKMTEAFGMDQAGMDLKIEDIEISILADGEFRVTEMKIKFIFDEDNETIKEPSLEMTAKYANFNAATPITDTLNPEDYTEFLDCRLLTEFEDMIEALEEKKDGSFTLNLEQKMSGFKLGSSQTYTEKDTVAYGEKNGSYFYDITANASGEIVEISYANGKQTIVISGTEQSVDQTEDEAKAYINGLINNAKYSANAVGTITKKADGVYEIQCDNPDKSDYSSIFSSLSINNPQYTQTITVTVKDGNISKIESHMIAEGVGLKIEVTSTLEVNA